MQIHARSQDLKRNKKIFLADKAESEIWDVFLMQKIQDFFLQSCWKLEFMLKAEMLEQVYIIFSQISK